MPGPILPVERLPETPRRNLVYSAVRALDALDLLAFGPLSTSELAALLGVHPRTARRLLGQLQDAEWVERRPHDRRYRLTLKLVAVACQALRCAPIHQPIGETLRRLASSFEGRFDCWTPSYGHVVALAPPHDNQRSAEGLTMGLAPRHATAGGKALLAYRDRWRAAAMTEPLERLTVHTICEPQALANACVEIAHSGVACESEEYEEGRWALAVPVLDEDGVAMVALSVTSWSAPIPAEGRLLKALRREATQLARAISTPRAS